MLLCVHPALHARRLHLDVYGPGVLSQNDFLSLSLPSTPPPPQFSVKEEEECPSSDACSIVHALPPICSPHSAASAETLRRLKGQIAHTKRREKDGGGEGGGGCQGNDTGREEEERGGVVEGEKG